jgi:hypothetical protein
MAKTIAEQVKERYGDQIKKTDTHTLMHLLRQERPDGTPFKLKEFGGKKIVESAQELAEAELRARGYQMPDFSSFFLVCSH